ncbi:helix-hairpin-helix domain-containing protein [Halorubrum aidingense]|nr:helix-hairpin-helix domain-containing protein [Halorubrum aidingense]
MSEVTATDHVHELADTGEISAAIADRLDDNGFETIADLLIADQKDLEDVPYVGAGRAADILAAVDDVEPEPLVDSREVVLEATLGEKLRVTMADRRGYANAFAVIDTEEPTVWETPDGDTWRTRRIRLSQKMAGDGADHEECDLVVGADGVRIEDPPVKSQKRYSRAKGWRVESVGAVGRVEAVAFAQLRGQQEQADVKPEGDDTWRKYQSRGEA